MKTKITISILVIIFFFAMNVVAQVNVNSISFDGTSGYVDVTDNPSSDFTAALTLQVWVKANSWGATVFDNYIIGKDDWAVASNGYALRAGGTGQISFNIASSTSVYWQKVITTATIPVGEWHNIAATFDGTSQKIYIDGIMVSYSLSPSCSIIPSDVNVNIGACPYSGGRFFDGLIDQVMIWNIALTDTEIINYAHCPPDVNATGLVAFWNFEEGTDTLTYDQTANGNTGTLMGGTSWSTDVPTQCSNAGIQEITSQPMISIFPNPASTVLNIHINSQHSILNSQLIITDILGNEVYKESLPQNVNCQLSIVAWNAGMYFYEIRGMNESNRGKFVKE